MREIQKQNPSQKGLNLLLQLQDCYPLLIFLINFGTSGRARTVTPVKEPDFESGVSTNSTTLAYLGLFMSKCNSTFS